MSEPTELIVKISSVCDFACTFCSSPSLSPKMSDTLDIEMIYKYLEKYPNTDTIIVNGGDPLMIKPDYYWDLISHLDFNGYKANISLTTNLWNYYNNPNKWYDLFMENRVDISTSFQYGDGRRISKNRVFKEKDFLKISNMFLDDFGYRPDFISVIDESNAHTAIDNVRLAKHLNVECKLNYANASGRQGKPFPLSSMYEIYLEIFREDLHHWEYNTKQMVKRLSGKPTSCQLLRDCDEHIRVLHPDGKYFSCGAFADDKEYEIDFDLDNVLKVATPLKDDINLNSLKDECYGCPMFQICNGCKKHIKDLKNNNMVESHCIKMKSIADEIIKASNGE